MMIYTVPIFLLFHYFKHFICFYAVPLECQAHEMWPRNFQWVLLDEDLGGGEGRRGDFSH